MKQIIGKLEIVQLALHATLDKVAAIERMEADRINDPEGAVDLHIQQEKDALKTDITNIINALSQIEKAIE